MRLALKIAMVVVLVLAILIPLSMIRGTIAERQRFRQQAVDEVTRSYAGEQAIAGPVLVLPYREQAEVEERDAQGVLRKHVREVEREWLFFAASMRMQGKVQPSIRKRGLHQVRVYELRGRIDARFDVRLPAVDPAHPREIGTPWLNIGIADVRGLVGAPALRVADAALPILQGQRGRSYGGVHAQLPVGTVVDGRIVFPLQFDFALRGTEALALVPLADSNRIVLASPWPHPQFNGDFLPRAHRIDATGFRAEWDVSSLASNAQAQYRRGGDATIGKTGVVIGGRTPDVDAAVGAQGPIDKVGLSLVEPVNLYSKVDRASKYGVLFVLLTFIGFFMFETLKQLPIHPIQYALVGLALAIFFLLLLGLSEHIAFGWAYMAAATACMGLIGFYVGHVLRSRARGLDFAAMLALVYAALYGLLVSEDNALVLGAGLLFAVLALIMVVTRKVDWYQVAARVGSHPPAGPVEAASKIA